MPKALRRKRPSKRKSLRAFLWPDMGLRRLSVYYRHRLCRLPGTPYFTAAGFASGVAISFTPFIGLHLVLGGLMTFFLRGSILAMAIGTLVGNPWTSPLIWLVTYKLGLVILGLGAGDKAQPPEAFTFSLLLDKPLDLLLPMTVGSAPFFAVSWIVSFHLARNLVRKYKDLRLARILRKHT